MYLWIWRLRRAGSLSRSIQATSSRGSRRPWTGESNTSALCASDRSRMAAAAQRGRQAVDLGQDLVERHLASAVEGVRRIAIAAAQVAAGRADEGAGATGESGLPLDAGIDLGDAHGGAVDRYSTLGPHTPRAGQPPSRGSAADRPSGLG